MSDALAALTLLLATAAAAETPEAVVSVHDGDTLTLASGVRVRLFGIDAPELDQPYGTAARDALAAMVNGRVVRVVEHATDRYGRQVGDVVLDGVSVNRHLVADGAAWCYTRYLPPGDDCPRIEAEARAARRGLWALPDPVPPWTWRAGGH